MTRYLCISVTFLDPLFHGKVSSDEPEWPPSPYRLFQALLSGARTGCRNREWNDSKAEAFRWLQKREPPLIVAPSARSATVYTLFVPNNDSDKKLDRQDRLTSKVVRPSRLLDEYPVHYLWRIEDADWLSSGPHVEQLCQEARHLLALGWGIDVVVGNGCVLNDQQAARLPGIRWKPWNGYHSPNGSRRRVPKRKTLPDLDEVHKSFVESTAREVYQPPQKPKVFKYVTYMQRTTLPQRPYVVLELRSEADAWAPFRQVDAIEVAAMLRHQACEAAKRDPHAFPGGAEAYVAGHVGKQEATPPRFSYLPLPTIGHPHADGLIRRVLIAERHGSDGAHVRWAKLRLQNRDLVDETHQTTAILIASKNRDNVLDAYLDRAQNWFSVTPVILPGYDDGKHTKAEKMLMKAIAQAGFPLEALQEIVLRKAPYWPGSQHPNLYHKPSYIKHLPGWHVMIRFGDPIRGPVAIGAGRHCGLGLLAQK